MHLTDTVSAQGPLRHAALALARLTAWRRYAVAAGFGMIAALALPPADLVFLLLVAFPGLVWLLDGARTKKQAFFCGWFFGFGHHLLGLYWISFALFTDIERFWWALPLSAAGLPVVLAMFSGGGTLAFWWIARRLGMNGLGRALLFAAAWGGVEWLRGHMFTGFPWNLVGYGWMSVLPVMQVASVIGVYGLTLVTVALAAMPVALTDPAIPRSRALAALATGLVVVVAAGGWGMWRLEAAPTGNVPGVRLRLVQAAIDQRLKWAPGEADANLNHHLELSAAPLAPAEPPVTHVIWPETAVPFFLEHDRARRTAIGAIAPSGGLVITGVPRFGVASDGERVFTNGMIAIDGSGQIAATYDKFHLVPFGEYVPFRRYLPVGPIAGNGAQFTPGPGPQTLSIKGLPTVSPLICYEVIFPASVLDVSQRPQWLLNLTNDAWYGRSAGPYQHFTIARVRAIEEGLPLVRVANTGISGVVDAVGRLTAYLPLGARGFLDSPLPKALPQATVYAQFGDLIFVVMLMSCFFLGLLARHPR